MSLVVAGQKVQVPIVVVPGQADNTVTLTIGQGRSLGGSVAPHVGVNANPLRCAATPYYGEITVLEKTGTAIQLARTQEHFNMEGRPLAREEVFSPGAIARVDHVTQPVPHKPRTENAKRSWGMSIDLSKCTGCSACVVACQAENNVSVVGIDGIRRKREMHWLRIDRYLPVRATIRRRLHNPLCANSARMPLASPCARWALPRIAPTASTTWFTIAVSGRGIAPTIARSR